MSWRDWSSAVCSSDLTSRGRPELTCPFSVFVLQPLVIPVPPEAELAVRGCLEDGDRESVVEGKSVVVGGSYVVVLQEDRVGMCGRHGEGATEGGYLHR